MASPSNASNSQSNSVWYDVFIKITPAIISILGFIFGVYQFNKQQSKNSQEEFDRRMFSNSLESYSKMTQIVGKMTVLQIPKDSTKYDSLQTEFDETYWGSLLLLQQDNVRQALRELKAEIVDVRLSKGSIENIRLRQDYLSEQFRVALRRYRDPDYDETNSK